MEQKKLTWFGVLVLVAFVIFIFFFNSKNKNTDTVSELPQPESVENESANEDNTENTGVIDDVKIVDSNKARLDEVLQRGNTEFSKGNYDKAIEIYNEALVIRKSDVVYARLYSAYSAKGDTDKALEMLDKAIEIYPAFTDYWVYKLTLLDEKTNTSFPDIKKVYEEAFSKVGVASRLNLILGFTAIAENNKEFSYAISLWEEAKKLYPENSATYQAEIDRLKTNL